MPVHKPASSSFVQAVLDDNIYTPDASELYTHSWHPLFVYGTLKQSFPRHSLLSGSMYLGCTYTIGTGWVMYRTQFKAPFPVVLEATSQNAITELKAGGIAGELYLVRPKIITNLDFIESNGIMYERRLRIVSLANPHTGLPVCRISAWMYIGINAHWKSAIARGDLIECDYLTKKKDPSYHYYTFMLKYVKKNALRNM